ncbi:prephenate dehydrogenase/arogenate dehydrogenase family protein [Halobium salinum]|uniref:Prephenate dehydrogenase/arogenate dehydrogenase family protein n=1 Tax=Halobium salinum TaxID=1364940 RepID=A0ABD5P6B4_9EURY|nr:prephenate dehydrogenase/arogenate dehydrogenase family protein [Halobium salinum]
MQLLIVGAGAMGRWVARTVDADVTFADVEAAAADEAAADCGGSSAPVDTDRRFDAVCLATPISAAADTVESFAPNAETAMFDVTGSMAAPVAAMRRAFDGERVSLHPLFAPENAPGNVAAVTDEAGPLTDGVRADLEDAGNHTFETTVDEHDRAMETVQSKAHAATLAYALAAEDVREEFATPVSAALDDVVETVTDGTPRVYAEIQETFPGSDAVADAAARLADADREGFEALYREASERRRGESPADRQSRGEDR